MHIRNYIKNHRYNDEAIFLKKKCHVCQDAKHAKGLRACSGLDVPTFVKSETSIFVVKKPDMRSCFGRCKLNCIKVAKENENCAICRVSMALHSDIR